MIEKPDWWDLKNPQWYIDFIHDTHPWDEGQALTLVRWLYEHDYEVVKRTED